MTPRRMLACVALAERRRRISDIQDFGVVRAAMHANKQQGEQFLDGLLED